MPKPLVLILTPEQRADLEWARVTTPYLTSANAQLPSSRWPMSNLGGK